MFRFHTNRLLCLWGLGACPVRELVFTSHLSGEVRSHGHERSVRPDRVVNSHTPATSGKCFDELVRCFTLWKKCFMDLVLLSMLRESNLQIYCSHTSLVRRLLLQPFLVQVCLDICFWTVVHSAACSVSTQSRLWSSSAQ